MPPSNPVKDLLDQHDLYCGATARLLDVASELGEVSKEILKSSNYGKTELERTPELEEEIGDLVFSVLALAAELHLEPQALLSRTLDKYHARLTEKGHIGSQED